MSSFELESSSTVDLKQLKPSSNEVPTALRPNPIKSLPNDVVNQIAAGEVVEKPSHLVKELIENSVDAGAKDILVEVDREARTFRVKDDGHGVPQDQLALALERHATSKIQHSDDLFRLTSFGFRGEALASMAAVSTLTLSSIVDGAGSGFQIKSEFGKISDVVSSSISKGTEIFVQSLFENVPARRKFLKTASHEIGQIRNVIKAMALTNPNVKFKLLVGGDLDLLLNLEHQALNDILGVRNLYSANSGLKNDFGCRVEFSSPVEVAKTSRNIWIFVQNRWVQDRTIQAAIMDAYRSLLMHGEYPQCAVFVSVPPDFVDVNIHPTKSQVKFVDSSKVYRLVQSVMREALSQAPWFRGSTPMGSTSNSISEPPSSSKYQSTNFGSKPSTFVFDHGPSIQEPVQSALFKNDSTMLRTKDYQMQRSESSNETQKTTTTTSTTFVSVEDSANILRDNHAKKYWSSLHVIGQHDLTYIVCQKDDELVLVDQHAAHERVAFEKLMKKWRGGRIDQQSFLFPLSIQLSEDRVEALVAATGEIENMGIEIERLGPSVIGVKSAPVFVKEKALIAVMERLSEELSERGASFAFEKSLTDIFATMACHSVVRAGQSLSLAEMNALLVEMDEFSFSSFCPHGRPVSVSWGRIEIEKLFGRRTN